MGMMRRGVLRSMIPVNDLLNEYKVVIRAASDVTVRTAAAALRTNISQPENGDVPLNAIPGKGTALVDPLAGSECAVTRRRVGRALARLPRFGPTTCSSTT
jgi:hypothetical protein